MAQKSNKKLMAETIIREQKGKAKERPKNAQTIGTQEKKKKKKQIFFVERE